MARFIREKKVGVARLNIKSECGVVQNTPGSCEGGGGRMGAVQVKRREHQCQNIKTKPASTAATQLPLDLLEIRRVFRRGNEEKPHSCTARPELRYHELSTEKRFMLVEDFPAQRRNRSKGNETSEFLRARAGYKITYLREKEELEGSRTGIKRQTPR